MKNPYDILGVNESSTDQDINKAYRSLAKKYHPDVNPSEEAARKMVEINCAYDEIKKMREKGQTYVDYQRANSYYNSGGGYQDSYQNGNYSQDIFSQVDNAIRRGAYFEAFIILQTCQNHNGKWYYYNAIIYAETGNINQALQFIEKAIAIEPNNGEYLALKESINTIYASKKQYYPYRRVSVGGIIFKVIMFMLFINIIVGCIAMF